MYESTSPKHLLISANEYRQTPTDRPGWCDVIDLMAVSDSGETAVATQFGLYPSLGVAALQVCVWLPGQPPIVLVESELAIPERLWEVRGSGLWVEHVCETPLVHWSYGLEAFALEVDDPQELLGRGYGTRVPLGWELEFESESESGLQDAGNTESNKLPSESESEALHGRYRQQGKVHGLILTKDGPIDFNGVGTRGHRWGPNAAIASTGPDLANWVEPSIALPGPGHVMWVDFSAGSIPLAKSEMAGR